MKTEIHITKHAKQRFKQRTGLPKSIMSKKVKNAFLDGLSHKKVKGTLGKKKLNQLVLKLLVYLDNFR